MSRQPQHPSTRSAGGVQLFEQRAELAHLPLAEALGPFPLELGHELACDRVQVGADEITVRVRSDETDGALFAAEVRMEPGGGPPVMHRHAPGELYHVLRGEFAFYARHGIEMTGHVTSPAEAPHAVGR